MNPNNLHQMSSLHRHWKIQAKESAKHLQIEAEDRRAYKEETVTSHTVYVLHVETVLKTKQPEAETSLVYDVFIRVIKKESAS